MVPPGCEDYWRSLQILPLGPLPYWLRHAGTSNLFKDFCISLLDTAKLRGFTFQRVALGEDGPLFGVRESLDYRDTVYIGGFDSGCHANRARKSSLIVPGGLPVT